MKTYYVYILSNQQRGALYIGMTNNIVRRVCKHKYGLIEGFTKRYGLDKLVWYNETSEVLRAIETEKQLKRWKRMWKIRLIEKENPEWDDLSATWRFDTVL